MSEREKRYYELSDMVDKLDSDDKLFMSWILLREYKNNIIVNEHADTINDFKINEYNRQLNQYCAFVIEHMATELWGC